MGPHGLPKEEFNSYFWKDKRVDRYNDLIFSSSTACFPSQSKGGNIDLFSLQITLFLLILTQLFPEPNFYYPEGRCLYTATQWNDCAKSNSWSLQASFFLCKDKNPISQKSIAWQITNQRQSLLHEDLKLKNFNVLNNMKSEAESWMTQEIPNC